MTKPDDTFKDNIEKALRGEANTIDENEKPASDSITGKIDVFLSYSSLNKNVADAVVADFEQHGIRCWYAPRDIMPGQEWVSAIHEAIKGCKLFVLIYTDSSNESKQVANEVALAFNSGKTLIPFKLSDAEMSSELEYYLTRVHWLDAVKPPLIESIENLRAYCEKILSGSIPKESKIKNANNIRKKQAHGFGFYAAVSVAAVLLVLGILLLVMNKSNKGSESTETVKGEETDIDAVYEEAYQYQTGDSEKTSYDKAYEAYMKTGEAVCKDEKIIEAMYGLASHYYESGSEEDIRKGLALYEKAAASGNLRACNFLGSYYLELEVHKAVKYYEASAEKGDAVALYSLGYIFENENGNYDIPADKEKALEYYKSAMNAGHDAAAKAYERLKEKIE